MRVLFDARPGKSCLTGIGRYARSVALTLRDLGPAHEVATIDRELSLSARNAIEEEFEFPGLLEREEIELLHTPLFHLPAILPCKSVVTIHDAIPAVCPELTNASFARFFEEARDSAARANAVVCPSESAKADVVRHLGVPAERVFVVPEAPDPVFRPASSNERARVRSKHTLGGTPYVLIVGSLERRKNPACVLEALVILGERAPLAVFAGPDAEFDLESAAQALRVRARCLGPVSDQDLAALYSDAAALVFPSFYEGFGLPIVEAFACETPVVASNKASIPEVAGEAARLFDPNDPAALAAALEELLASPELRRDLVARGRERLRHFTSDRVRDAFANLYTTLERRAA